MLKNLLLISLTGVFSMRKHCERGEKQGTVAMAVGSFALTNTHYNCCLLCTSTFLFLYKNIYILFLKSKIANLLICIINILKNNSIKQYGHIFYIESKQKLNSFHNIILIFF